MKLVVTFSATMLMSIAALAQVSTNQPPKSIGQTTASDPGPSPIGGPIRYSTLKSAWEAGANTSEAMLKGTWIAIAEVTNVPCAYNGKDRSNPKGLSNKDGSPYATFEFDSFVNDQTSGQVVFGVQILNMGTKNADQGPYAVDPNQPQFATYTYGGGTLQTSFYSYSCRSVSANGLRMICANRLNIAASAETATGSRAAKACAASGYGIMTAYKKVIN